MMEHYHSIKPLECTVVGPGVVVKVEEEETYSLQNDRNPGGTSMKSEVDVEAEQSEGTCPRRKRKADRRKRIPEKIGSVNPKHEIVIKTEDGPENSNMRNDEMYEVDRETKTGHSVKPEIEVKLEEDDQSYVMGDQQFEERDSSPAASPDYFLVQIKEEEEDVSFGMDYQQHGEKVVRPQTSSAREKDGRIHRMSSKMFIDIAQLIQLVQERPELYNPKTPSYADRYKKKKAWDEICAIVVPDWELCSEKEKNIKVKIIKTKWKSLRDRFKKDARETAKARSSQAPSRYRVHPLYEEFKFLLPVLKKRPSSRNVQLSELEEAGEEEDIIENLPSRPSSSADTETVDSMPNAPSDVETELEMEVPTLLPHSTPTSSPSVVASRPRSAVRGRGREKAAEKNEILALIEKISHDVEKSSRPQDDISLFLQSLDAEMRKVPLERQSLLKLEMLKLVVSFQHAQTDFHGSSTVLSTAPPVAHPSTLPVPPQGLSYPYASLPAQCTSYEHGHSSSIELEKKWVQ